MSNPRVPLSELVLLRAGLPSSRLATGDDLPRIQVMTILPDLGDYAQVHLVRTARPDQFERRRLRPLIDVVLGHQNLHAALVPPGGELPMVLNSIGSVLTPVGFSGPPRVRSAYLMLALRSPEVQHALKARQISTRVRGVETQVRLLSIERLKDVPIPLPPLEVQDQVIETYGHLRTQIETLERAVGELLLGF